jgi:hypothetical protein
MANLYNVPLENGVQLTTQNALLTGGTSTITFTASVTSKLQASATIPGILVIDRVDPNGTETPTKTEYISFTGVTGSTVTGLVRGLANTTDQDHSAGAIVEFVPDVIWADSLNDVFTTEHASDGKHTVIDPTAIKQNIVTATDGATITFDLNTSNIFSVTLGASGRTLALSNETVGQCFIIRLIQGGSGSNLVTFFTTIKWSQGVTPVLTTTLNKTDVFGFICTSAGNFDGFIVGQDL